MKKLLLITLALTLCACAPYRLKVQQGNLVTKDQIAHLHNGMTKAQVLRLLGDPVMENMFSTNRWHYVHSFQPNNGYMSVTRLTVYFREGRVIRVLKSREAEVIEMPEGQQASAFMHNLKKSLSTGIFKLPKLNLSRHS